jgi:hypothetical protein
MAIPTVVAQAKRQAARDELLGPDGDPCRSDATSSPDDRRQQKG